MGLWLTRSYLEDIKPPPVWVNLTKPAPRQVADIAKPKKEEKPVKANAESLYNQKVKEETVAARTPSPATPPNKTEKPVKAAPKTEPAPPSPKHIPGMPEQMLAPQQDFLAGYKVGNRTYLNTDANPGVAYYVELKRKFRLTFSPRNILRAHAAEIHGSRVVVVLGLSVNANGGIANVVVIKSSGIEAYDREGIRTVKASGPFSPPPADKLTPEGLHNMAWNFIVSIY